MENDVVQPALCLAAVEHVHQQVWRRSNFKVHQYKAELPWSFWAVCVIHSNIHVSLDNYPLVTSDYLHKLIYIANSDSCDVVSAADVQLSFELNHLQ